MLHVPYVQRNTQLNLFEKRLESGMTAFDPKRTVRLPGNFRVMA